MARTIPSHSSATAALAIERVLRETYLDVRDGDFSPLASVDATAERLGLALEPFNLDGDSHAAVLARACGDSASALAVFDGRAADFVWPDADSPGVLRYLVLACVLLARPEDAADNPTRHAPRNFYRNLGLIFGRDVVVRAQGLPVLWDRLVRWADERHKVHGDVRRVVTSPTVPGRGPTHTWRLLGPTYRMTLLSWRDAGQLERWLARRPSLLNDPEPDDLARHLPNLLKTEVSLSDAFLEAARSFLDLYERRATLLAHHRFWRAFRSVRDRMPFAAPTNRLRVLLLLGDRVGIRIAQGASGPAETLAPDIAMGLLRARVRDAEPGVISRSLGAMIEDEAIRFHRTDLSVCEVEPLMPIADDAYAFVLLGERHRRAAEDVDVSLREIAARWWLTAPLRPQELAALGVVLGIDLVERKHRRDARTNLQGGVRVGRGSWLGFDEFLPAVRTASAGIVRSASPDLRAVLVVDPEAPGDLWALRSETTLDGARSLEIEEGDASGVSSIVVCAKLSFSREAHEHPRIGAPSSDGRWDPSDGTDPTPADGVSMLEPVACSESLLGAESEEDGPVERLLEAIYAGGASGLAEHALLPLIRRSAIPNAWAGYAVLAALEEARWLCSAHVVGWRARRWWLLPPSLGPVGDEPCQTILHGSASRAIRRRFRRTTMELGGRVVRAPGSAIVAPPVLVAVGVDRAALAEETGWSIESSCPAPSEPAPGCWTASRGDGSTHARAALWDWNLNRFRPDVDHDVPEGPVAVERLRREGGDRPDLYRASVMTAGTPPFMTQERAVAVTEAYRLAARPFLDREGDRLLAPSADSRLPLSIARHLRDLEPFTVSGPLEVNGQVRYAYPWSRAVRDALVQIYGQSFLSGVDTSPGVDTSVEANRHSRRHAAVRELLARRRRRVDEATVSELASEFDARRQW